VAMELKDKTVEFLLNQLGFSQKDLDKVKTILDNINVKTVGDSTIIEVRLNKVSVIVENNKDVY
jgi:hypothetical protein